MIQDALEVILLASSWVSAQCAVELIDGCHTLVWGEPGILGVDFVAHNEQEPRWMNEDKRAALPLKICSTTDFPLACAVAAAASRQRKWVYAIAKYRFSLSLFSVYYVDLEPWTSPHLPISPFPGDHVRFAHAIISAYSVVEDLGLSLRASASKPSQLSGRWNPEVRRDLEERLVKAGVDLSEMILWTARGGKRRIEKRRPIPAGNRAPWSWWWLIRDTEIPIIDAIAYAEWLRSCVASHGVKDLTEALSPYDVINVQHLARRLVLECLGFWRWQEKSRM